MDFQLECEKKYIEMLDDVARNNYQPPTLKKVERLINLCYKDIAKCDRQLRDPVFLDIRYGEKKALSIEKRCKEIETLYLNPLLKLRSEILKKEGRYTQKYENFEIKENYFFK